MRIEIENGLERRLPTFCVDYKSLWNLIGQEIWARDICPRDGSGYRAAKFAIDGNLTAISHGNHPEYFLNIIKRTEQGGTEVVSSENLDPSKLPIKILIRDGEVFGDYGNTIRNFSAKTDVEQITEGDITSLSDSGNYTVKHNEKTHIQTIGSNKTDTLKGDYVFIEATPQ